MNQPSTATRLETQELPVVISAEFLAILRRYGVSEAKLCGSVARGEERPDSDIDLLVTFDQEVSRFQRMDLAEELSQLSGREVDLITKIKPAFVPYIIPTLVPIPV